MVFLHSNTHPGTPEMSPRSSLAPARVRVALLNPASRNNATTLRSNDDPLVLLWFIQLVYHNPANSCKTEAEAPREANECPSIPTKSGWNLSNALTTCLTIHSIRSSSLPTKTPLSCFPLRFGLLSLYVSALSHLALLIFFIIVVEETRATINPVPFSEASIPMNVCDECFDPFFEIREERDILIPPLCAPRSELSPVVLCPSSPNSPLFFEDKRCF